MKQGSKGLVIYLDDDMDDLGLMIEAFENYPHVQLLTFKEIHPFLDYLLNDKLSPIPSLVLIDINLPLLNGKELLKRLKACDHLKKVLIVLYSTSSSEADEKFAKGMHTQLITKPVTIAQLDKTIEALLRQCGLIG